MQFQFNGEDINIPDDVAVKMLSDGDLADGLLAFAEDFETALGNIDEAAAKSGKSPEELRASHSVIVLTLKEAGRRLKAMEEAGALIESLMGDKGGFPFPLPKKGE